MCSQVQKKERKISNAEMKSECQSKAIAVEALELDKDLWGVELLDSSWERREAPRAVRKGRG